MNKFDLNDIERRVQRSFYQDGLLELMAGIFMTYSGLMASRKVSVVFLPLMVLLSKTVMEAAKRRFIYPRIGYVKFREEEPVDGKGFGRGIIGLAILAVASPFISILIMGKGPGWEFWTRRFLPLFMGAITAIGFIAAARKLRVYRWYAFAVVCVAAGLGVPFLGLESIYEPITIEFMIIGGAALITGLVMFVVFLLRYPADKQQEGSDETG